MRVSKVSLLSNKNDDYSRFVDEGGAKRVSNTDNIHTLGMEFALKHITADEDIEVHLMLLSNLSQLRHIRDRILKKSDSVIVFPSITEDEIQEITEINPSLRITRVESKKQEKEEAYLI
ncbi:MAG: hypothetical protein ACXAE3_09530 [Candidatus Kariarchaeaceae archaeon]|jgi:hypothetical protein